MIEGRYIYGDEDITEAVNIRRIVFNMEQGVPEELDKDNEDEKSIIALAYNNKIPVATGRLIFEEKTCRISKIAVLEEYRGKSYGDFIVRMLIDKAVTFGAERVSVISQVKAKTFYEKIGFNVSGEIFMLNNIERIPMILVVNNVLKKCKC